MFQTDDPLQLTGESSSLPRELKKLRRVASDAMEAAESSQVPDPAEEYDSARRDIEDVQRFVAVPDGPLGGRRMGYRKWGIA